MTWWVTLTALFGALTVLLGLGLPVAFAFLGVNLVGALLFLGGEPGLMQVVRPRPGPSILERAQLDRAGTEAIDLLESALADGNTGSLRLAPRPAVRRWLESRPHLLEALGDRTHRPVEMLAGAPDADGRMPEGSLNARVAAQLAELSSARRAFAADHHGSDESAEPSSPKAA